MDDLFKKPYFLSKHGDGGSSAAIADDQEFQEADVWEAVNDHHFNTLQPRSSKSAMRKSKSSNSFASSSAIGDCYHGGQPQSSGPLLTPSWSHTSAGKSKKSSTSITSFSNYYGNQKQQDVEADEDEMIPPHEMIARRLARSQILSSSVCEGVGRTLKGRDLSRVRNAVLAKTGFLEQQ